jgi:hypothetical protein
MRKIDTLTSVLSLWEFDMIGLKPSVIDAVAAVFLLCACAGSRPESSATGMQPGTSACNAVNRAQQSGPLRLNINRDGSLVDLQVTSPRSQA